MDWKDALKNLSADMAPTDNDAQQAPAAEPSDKKKPTLTLFYERKGRGGKEATIITGLDPDDNATLKELASEIKRALATGGSQRDGEILVQGDRREQLRALLPRLGYRVKG